MQEKKQGTNTQRNYMNQTLTEVVVGFPNKVPMCVCVRENERPAGVLAEIFPMLGTMKRDWMKEPRAFTMSRNTLVECCFMS